MFDSLAEQMRRDDHLEISNMERAIRWTAVVVLSLAIFGGIFVGVHFLQ
ncbi:MAG TPA: hypothetical protein VLY24_26365 [Bryobacteraceae bacterium]|nr:hypothetical protein [Bryobacteraceae bacterium]